MNPKTIKLHFDSSVCSECKKKDVMYETETDEWVERWCSSCSYYYRYNKKWI